MGKLLLKVAVGACAVVLSTSSRAGDLTDSAMAAASHIGQAMAIEVICPRLKVHETNVAIAAVVHGVDLADPTIKAIVVRKRAEAIAAWKGKDQDMACAAGLMLYGPTGANVPNLVERR